MRNKKSNNMTLFPDDLGRAVEELVSVMTEEQQTSPPHYTNGKTASTEWRHTRQPNAAL